MEVQRDLITLTAILDMKVYWKLKQLCIDKP